MDQSVIYREHAAEYDALVSAEDCDGNLVPAIAAVARLDGAFVVDVGTGTGRVARMLLSRARHIIGVEPQEAMLAVARARLADAARDARAWAEVELHRASAHALPVADGVADLAIAGWVFGHFRHWMPERWREDVARALAEMNRVVRPGGAIVIVETLGTGRDEADGPTPPNAALAEYYAWLESAHGFTRAAIRTDYSFRDVETAARICGFFFGDSMAKTIRERGSSRVPEWTGVWSRVRA
jgi:ubiquinone/menaquinone biosynthesis C-methylase UbiE